MKIIKGLLPIVAACIAIYVYSEAIAVIFGGTFIYYAVKTL